MKHHHYSAGTRKKRPASRVFFFLPAFGRCCPSVSVHPANRIHYSSNIKIADHFPSKTFSFKHHLTGEAWPACRAILPFHSNNIAIADHLYTVRTSMIAKNWLLNIGIRCPGNSCFARLTTQRCVWTRVYRMTWYIWPWRCAPLASLL